ncbi:ankyrin repeat-containing domain protein [Flagelloscypha sp. PMI_526]|nr:ankyrin repeat-containing domain protein [Flagelloscypha sp. PMI_526]
MLRLAVAKLQSALRRLFKNPSAGDVMVHSRAYIKRQEVKEKMDTIIDGLNGRKCILKVSEIVFPKAGQLERLAADVSHMRAAMDSSNLDDIINWLSAGYTIEDELSSFITPQGGDSGNWLIESEEMDHWVLGYYRLLLLKGPPGCGKTTLASIVVARLRDLQQSAVFPIFIKYSGIFTKFTVFSRLVVQLLRCVATVPPKLEELYQSKLQPDILVLASILTSMLESWEYPIFIVLDALDEFTSSSQRDLVSDLLELAPNVQVFVTSRQIPESICTSQRLIALHGSNHADLGRYIHSQVSMLPYLTPSGAKEELTDKVMKASRGIFLLASLHMQELRECRSLMRAQDVAEQLPTTPEERYHLSIERLKSKPSHDRLLAIHTLMWVWIAKRRLTLGEISHAVASSTHDLTDRCVEDALVPEAILLSLCDGLVVAANDYIEFIHITTQEFLNSFGPEIFKAMLPIVGPGCLGYLNASRPSTVIANWSQQPSESDLKSLSSVEHRFFYYCAALWGEHAREGSAQYLRHFIRLLESSERYHICVRIRFKQEPDSHWPAAWSPQYTPLHLAASLGLGDCVEYLIQGSHAYLSPINIISTGPALIEADVRDNQGHSPLSRASQHGHTGVVQFLLAQTTVDANSQDEMGRSPLTWACMCGHVDTVRLLLSIETLAINMCDNQRHSPLAYACTKGHLEIVRLLLAQDSLEVNTCDKWGYLPVTRACGGDHADVVRLLLTQGTVDVNTLDPNGQSPLAWACERGHVDIVQLLLARNSVEVNTRDKWSYSPLVKACDGGHADIVRLLLQRSDIEVNAPDLLGQSPLARACDAGHAGIVQLLLARETLEVNARDKWGYSALVRACDRGNLDIVQLLLTQDALDVNTPDLSGRSPLARACDKGYTDIVRLLLSKLRPHLIKDLSQSS